MDIQSRKTGPNGRMFGFKLDSALSGRIEVGLL
jgi:hypothetical protein